MNWTLIGHRSELANPGDYVSLGEVAVYNASGEIVAFSGICPHRGTRLFTQAVGNQALTCPYHGMTQEWIVPRVSRFLTQWVGDWLFAGTGEKPLEAIAIAEVAARHSYDTIPMACDWRIAVENALEDLHVPHVHAKTFGRLGLKLEKAQRFGANHSVAFYRITNERMVKQLSEFTETPDSYFHMLIYPNVCVSSVGGLTYSVQHYLSSGAATQLLTRLYIPPVTGQNSGLAFLYDQAREFNRRVFYEDAEICARVSGRGQTLLPGECRIAWFRAAQDVAEFPAHRHNVALSQVQAERKAQEAFGQKVGDG